MFKAVVVICTFLLPSKPEHFAWALVTQRRRGWDLWDHSPFYSKEPELGIMVFKLPEASHIPRHPRSGELQGNQCDVCHTSFPLSSLMPQRKEATWSLTKTHFPEVQNPLSTHERALKYRCLLSPPESLWRAPTHFLDRHFQHNGFYG